MQSISESVLKIQSDGPEHPSPPLSASARAHTHVGDWIEPATESRDPGVEHKDNKTQGITRTVKKNREEGQRSEVSQCPNLETEWTDRKRNEKRKVLFCTVPCTHKFTKKLFYFLAIVSVFPLF